MARRHIFQSNPNMWSAGAVVLPHQQAHAQYANQLALHQQAKDQALSQYYDKVQSSINPQGIRDVDMDGWQKKADEWNKFGIENRQFLIDPRRDGGKALGQFNSMHRDLLGDLAKSKQAAQTELQLKNIWLDPKKRQLSTAKDLEMSHRIGLPIYDQNHYKDGIATPFGAEDFSFNAPPFDLPKQKMLFQEATRGLKKDRTYNEKQGSVNTALQRISVPYSERYSNENLKAIAERVGAAYEGDPSMQSYFENTIHDPEQFEKLNTAFQSVYKDKNISSPRDAAMAFGILNNQGVNVGAEDRKWSRPPVGRSGGMAGQQYNDMINWVNGTANAIQKGDVSELKRYGSALYQGPVKTTRYQDVDFGPFQEQSDVNNYTDPDTKNIINGKVGEAGNIKQGAIFYHKDHQWNPDTRQWEDVMNNTKFSKDDPYLKQKLTGYFQTHYGPIRKLNATPFYQNQGQEDTDQQPPPTAVKTPANIKVDPDALLKKYGVN